MKKTVLTVGIAMLFVVGSATFIGCGNAENHDGDAHEHAEGEEHEDMDMSETEHAEDEMENHEEMASSGSYYCTMKCEGDKTYDEAGECPKCGMDLTEVEE
jgi:transcription initiation factor IIE alpha subunit